jgi:hypothetical protein
MVTALLAGVLLLAADPSTTASESPRPLVQIERDVSAALKQEATAKDRTGRAAAIQALCDLHESIVSDQRHAVSDTLKSYRVKLWSRLTRVKRELRSEAARAAGKPADQQAEAQVRMPAASLASTLALADFAGGAPTGLLARGGAAQTASNAQSLIELIERTIDPDFWDVNGGPGAIVYYPPLQCLVIRATSEVHGKIGGAIGGVRDAGR